MPAAAIQQVIACSAIQAVLPFQAIQRIRIDPARQAIGQLTAGQNIRERIAGNGEGLTWHVAGDIFYLKPGQAEARKP